MAEAVLMLMQHRNTASYSYQGVRQAAFSSTLSVQMQDQRPIQAVRLDVRPRIEPTVPSHTETEPRSTKLLLEPHAESGQGYHRVMWTRSSVTDVRFPFCSPKNDTDTGVSRRADSLRASAVNYAKWLGSVVVARWSLILPCSWPSWLDLWFSCKDVQFTSGNKYMD